MPPSMLNVSSAVVFVATMSVRPPAVTETAFAHDDSPPNVASGRMRSISRRPC